jgi:hypothetical protein
MPTRISDDELVELWHNGVATHLVARDCDVSAEFLQSRWKLLKAEGRLPMTKRPVKSTAAKGPAPPDKGDDNNGCPLDDGGMLDALWAAHPEGPREDLFNDARAKARAFGAEQDRKQS